MKVRLAAVALASMLAVGLNAPAAHAGEGSVHCGKFVYGAIEDKYAALNAQAGVLGCPTAGETDAANGGRWEPFANGAIYWHPSTGPFEVHGAILGKWTQHGRERGYGYPLTDESRTSDGIGRFNHFQNGGSIYWTPATGAHTVYGAIRNLWASARSERSCLGYPIDDEADTAGGGGRVQHFQNGTVYWTPGGGAHSTC